MARMTPTGVRADNAAAIDRIRARLQGVSEAQLQRASRRAIITTRRRFEPAAKRAITAEYNVRKGDLSGQFEVRTFEAEGGEALELAASTRKLPLLGFGAKWRGKARVGGKWTQGASAEVQRGQRREYKSAFIRSIGGKRYVLSRQFSRDGQTASGRHPREKLRRLMGPSPAQMTRGVGDSVSRRITDEMVGVLRIELRRQIKMAGAR